MTYEEAMIHFKEQLEIFGGEHHEAMKVAIEALEKQIPKPVIRHHGNYDCPVCNKPAMAITARKKKYCDFCGQALDWGE